MTLPVRLRTSRHPLDGVTQSSLEQLDARTGNASRDLAGASVLLADDLNKVILDWAIAESMVRVCWAR